ncbi:ATP-binding protein [Streptomyces sp. NPDC050704]|uniref:ATP-binding protein n=1 Tax=Streptomyces sp. NPDC050704 TaxID=3157219 RepID=UPI00341451C5
MEPATGSDERSIASPLSRPQRPQELHRSFPIRPEAVRLARTYARRALTMTSWPGDQEDAARIVAELVKNAVEHVGSEQGELVLDLVIAEDETLRIAVTDPSPQFPAFWSAVSAQKATGLPLIRELGGETTWRPTKDGDKKTVQVRLSPRSSQLTDSP